MMFWKLNRQVPSSFNFLLYFLLHEFTMLKDNIYIYYIDTDEIPGFFLLLKNHIFIARSEDTIFIFHV